MHLLLAHEAELLRYVMVFVPQRADARDIIQETAVALWKNFEGYDQARPFVGWACGFARVEVRRFVRRAQRQRALTERALEALLGVAEEDMEVEHERERLLWDCLGQMPVVQRQLLDDYYIHEQSVEAIAREQSRTVEAIYKALQRIRRALLDCVERKQAEAGI